MPVHSMLSDPVRVRVCLASNRCIEALLVNLPPNPPDAILVLNGSAQTFFDTRVLLTDLPPDAPDRLANPGRPDLFWDGDYLVGRSVVVENIEWLETESTFRFELRSVV
jgi:hypothetical protein